MGASQVRIAQNQKELNQFTQHLIKDIKALQKMLEDSWFEDDIVRIGAEQEICLVDDLGKPSASNMKVLEKLNHPSFTTELAQFNLEANLDPIPFTGNCFSKLESDIQHLLGLLRDATSEMDVDWILTGILPTIRKFDIEYGNITPIDRYYCLVDAIGKLRGEDYELKIGGMDELNLKQTTALIEACNTSFQVHLQIKPQEFVKRYNIAQAIAAPILALSSNSPMLFGKRLWSETRIALFQQSVDTRITGEHLRYTSPRVTLGHSWLKDSILDLYREDIVRFKVLLMTDVEEDVFESLEQGKTPKLKALNIHNSTVYRWNRPCYGISDNGKPHLRIENRIFPAGPTVVDEVANATFWIGLMNGFDDAYPDITQKLDFDDAKSNFMKAARVGLGSQFIWANGKAISDRELIEKELLPLARIGLKKANILEADIDKYLGVIEERNKACITGASWMLDSYARLIKETTRDEASAALIAGMLRNTKTEQPVHEWKLASLQDISEWEPHSLLVEEFMTTDFFTISKDDIPELGANIMDWQYQHYLPIENQKGELVGLLTSRGLLRYFADYSQTEAINQTTIEQLMIKNPLTVSPDSTVIEALELMNQNVIGCLPVVNKKKLVGVITTRNFLDITSSLLKRLNMKKKMNLNGQKK